MGFIYIYTVWHTTVLANGWIYVIMIVTTDVYSLYRYKLTGYTVWGCTWHPDTPFGIRIYRIGMASHSTALNGPLARSTCHRAMYRWQLAMNRNGIHANLIWEVKGREGGRSSPLSNDKTRTRHQYVILYICGYIYRSDPSQISLSQSWLWSKNQLYKHPKN